MNSPDKPELEATVPLLRELWAPTRQGRWIEEGYTPGLVSVIIPTFNRAGFLMEALASVHDQTYRPIEVLLVDDGSTDNTKEVFERWARQVENPGKFQPMYLRQKRSGAPAARNHGLIQSKGEFIQFLDSDDFIHPQKLEIHARCLRTMPKCDSAWSPLIKFIDGKKPEINYYPNDDGLIQKVVVKEAGNHFCALPHLPTSGLHRRFVILNVGPWLETLTRWQDLEYHFRFGYLNANCACVPEFLYFFRTHELERIHTQYQQRTGLQGGFDSLAAIEMTVAKMTHRNAQMEQVITQNYMSLAKMAAKYDVHADFKAALAGAMRHRADWGFRARVRAFDIINRCLGGATADRLFRVYSRLNGVSIE